MMGTAARVDLGVNMDLAWCCLAPRVHHGDREWVQQWVQRVGITEGNSEDQDRIGDRDQESEVKKALERGVGAGERTESRSLPACLQGTGG